MEQKKTGISRRSFLAGTGAAVGALAAGSLVGYNAEAKATVDDPGAGIFLWKDISVVTVMQNAFDGYFISGCCFGASYGIVKTLRDSGAAAGWTSLPLDMFKWGAGGGNSWGTLCGALNGTFAVLNLAGKQGASNANIIALNKWYERANFPLTEDCAELAAEIGNDTTTAGTLLYYVKNTSPYKVQDNNADGKNPDFATKPRWGNNGQWADDLLSGAFKRSISYSPLCHASVSRWCDASGKTVGGLEKKFRCAMLTAAVAGIAVKHVMGAFLTGGNNLAGEQCASCHTTGASTYDSAQGAMDCTGCHDTRADDTVSGEVYNVAPECSR